jgi:hypothetical protein
MRLFYFPGTVKLWESPGRAGGLPNELTYQIAKALSTETQESGVRRAVLLPGDPLDSGVNMNL